MSTRARELKVQLSQVVRQVKVNSSESLSPTTPVFNRAFNRNQADDTRNYFAGNFE
jgi:hypothetical protein